MKKFALLFCLGALMSLLLAACSVDEDENPKVVADIEDDYLIVLWEDLGLPARSLQFRVETVDEQPCLNTFIDYAYRRSTSALNLSLNGILEPHPSECNENPSTIQQTIDLGFLSEGVYDMQINLKNAVVNNGLLTVRNDRYQLDMYTDDGFHLQQTEMWRVPENTFWGYVAYRNTDASSLATAFLDEMAEAAATLSLKAGYYGHFDVQDDKSLVLADVPPNKYINTFAYAFDDNQHAIEALLEEYRTLYGEQLELKIYTDTGEVW